jgi:hypothetical protein
MIVQAESNMREFLDLLGQSFGRWGVIEFAGLTRFRAAKWKVECECGTEKIIRSDSLTNGRSKSCGCLQREQAAARLAAAHNYRESAPERTLRMWASGIRSRIRTGKIVAGKKHPRYRHGLCCKGSDRRVYDALKYRKRKATTQGVRS